MNYFGFNRNKIMLFLGGAIFSSVATQMAKSKCCKKLCVSALAQGMKMKDDIEHQIAVIKEEAEDMYNEAKCECSEAACECNDSSKEKGE